MPFTFACGPPPGMPGTRRVDLPSVRFGEIQCLLDLFLGMTRSPGHVDNLQQYVAICQQVGTPEADAPHVSTLFAREIGSSDRHRSRRTDLTTPSSAFSPLERLQTKVEVEAPDEVFGTHTVPGEPTTSDTDRLVVQCSVPLSAGDPPAGLTTVGAMWE